MNILFTVCGRAGSKGVKNKNVRNLYDKPLLYYTLAAIDLFRDKDNEHEIDVAINSDSDLLLQMASEYNSDYIILGREEKLSGDMIQKIDVIKDCLIRCEEINKKKYDIIVDFDITAPFRTLKNIKEIINKKLLRRDLDLIFSVCESRRNPYFNMVMRKKDGETTKVIDSRFVARQEAPEIFDMTGSLYAYERDFLIKEEIYIFDSKCDIIEVMDTGVLDIDSENDYELINVIASYIYSKKDEYKEIRDSIRI